MLACRDWLLAAGDSIVTLRGSSSCELQADSWTNEMNAEWLAPTSETNTPVVVLHISPGFGC